MRGVTSVVGSGGKTTLLRALSERLPGTVILTTSTHIYPFQEMPVLIDPTEDEVARALEASRVICVGEPAEEGKLRGCTLASEVLAGLADHVVVEADGSRMLPLKAHASWEPVVPECSRRCALVVGASGFGRPVREVAHRPQIFCELAGCGMDDPASPELVGRVIAAEREVTRADVVVVNQAEGAERIEMAGRLARELGEPVVAGSVRDWEFRVLEP